MVMELGLIALSASVISAGVIYITLVSLRKEKISLETDSGRRDHGSMR